MRPNNSQQLYYMGFDFSEKCLHLNMIIDHNGPRIGLYPKIVWTFHLFGFKGRLFYEKMAVFRSDWAFFVPF